MKDFKDPFCILPLRDIVVFPNMIVPLFVGRTKSIKALEYAEKNDKEIFLVAQKDANVDEPNLEDIYNFGTVATILQLLRLPDGTVKVLVEGVSKKSKQELYGRNSQNTVIVFPKEDCKPGDYVLIYVESCTSATLKGKVIKVI